MTRRGSQTRAASSADALGYLAKAKEFLRAAGDSLELGNNTAATGNATHAGINAADAIAALRAGAVWRGEHDQAATYLERTGNDGRQAARHLRRLLPLKSRAEYDPGPIGRADARTAVTAAERLVAIAERVVAT